MKEYGIGSSGMKGWRGISEGPWELKVGRGMEIHGGNMLSCQPSNFSNRRKLVMNNCWVGYFLREKTCSVQNQKVIFLIINLHHSPYEILHWQSVCWSFLLSCTRPCCAHLLIWEVLPTVWWWVPVLSPCCRLTQALCESFLQQLWKPDVGFTSLSPLVAVSGVALNHWLAYLLFVFPVFSDIMRKLCRELASSKNVSF